MFTLLVWNSQGGQGWGGAVWYHSKNLLPTLSKGVSIHLPCLELLFMPKIKVLTRFWQKKLRNGLLAYIAQYLKITPKVIFGFRNVLEIPNLDHLHLLGVSQRVQSVFWKFRFFGQFLVRCRRKMDKISKSVQIWCHMDVFIVLTIIEFI